jgi:eukaryotic-like serine/threonine-protein kinase
MIGRMIAGRYKITAPLDAGGMGETYIAIDTQFPKEPQCVVKRLLPASKDPGFLEILQRLFRSEAATLAKVGEHDQIPRLLAYPEENQEFYLVQEYIEGHTLSNELKQQWSESQVLRFLMEILGVLKFLQSQDPQVIHRDIKPANIIRRSKDGKLVLIDFGAVKEWQAQQLTQLGKPSIVIGTPEYMPAEQFKGKPRPSSDLYAVGMIAIQALTGLLPSVLEEDDDGEAVWRSQASISRWLADFLTKMVRRDFKERYQTAAEASQALQGLMRRAATVVTPRSVPQNVAPALTSPPAPAPAVVTPRPAIPQKPQRVSAPSTVYQPPPSSVAPASPASPSRRNFLRRSLYIGLGSFGAISAYFFTFVMSSRSKRFKFETVSVNAQGKIIERKAGEAEFFTEDLGNGVVLDIVAIPGGSFTMGSPESEAGRYNFEGPQRTVTIQPFYMGKYVVTQAQWQAVAKLPQVKQGLEANPSRFKGANLPVEQVSWDDAVEFCARLSQLKGRTYRLPSEAEWEYACRAGTDTPFYFGETLTEDVANYNANYAYANGPKGKYRAKTTDVDVFPPNGFGLYDMHGNVWEWCADRWHESYQGAPTDGSAWLSRNDNDNRLLRGGSWDFYPRNCRSAFRLLSTLDLSNYGFGFRVVCATPRTL